MDIKDLTNQDSHTIDTEEMARIINKKVTLFGVRTDELTWALRYALFPSVIFLFITFVLAYSIMLYEAYDETAVWLKGLSDFMTALALSSIPLFFIGFFLMLRVLRNLNKRFGDGAALTALSTTSLLTMIFNAKGAKKNFGFNIKPNNNFERIE